MYVLWYAQYCTQPTTNIPKCTYIQTNQIRTFKGVMLFMDKNIQYNILTCSCWYQSMYWTHDPVPWLGSSLVGMVYGSSSHWLVDPPAASLLLCKTQDIYGSLAEMAVLKNMYNIVQVTIKEDIRINQMLCQKTI